MSICLAIPIVISNHSLLEGNLSLLKFRDRWFGGWLELHPKQKTSDQKDSN